MDVYLSLHASDQQFLPDSNLLFSFSAALITSAYLDDTSSPRTALNSKEIRCENNWWDLWTKLSVSEMTQKQIKIQVLKTSQPGGYNHLTNGQCNMNMQKYVWTLAAIRSR